MQLYFPPVKGIGTLKLAIAFSNSSNVGHQPQCMCFQTSFRICLCCKTYLPARSHRQGWSGQETSSKIYKTRLRLESQGVANDGFIVHRIFERKKKNQQFVTLYVPSKTTKYVPRLYEVSHTSTTVIPQKQLVVKSTVLLLLLLF